MTINIVLTLPVIPEKREDLFLLLKELGPGTQAFGGCLSYDILKDINNSGNVVFIEQWQSMASYEKYNAWRTETGVMERLGAFLAGAPSIAFCEQVDAWSK
jgi:quinol monooxygenase YgiN